MPFAYVKTSIILTATNEARPPRPKRKKSLSDLILTKPDQRSIEEPGESLEIACDDTP